MELEKKRIAHIFNRQAKAYDRHAVIQQRMAHRIIQTLDENGVDAEKVLELGCGTGYFTLMLTERFPNAFLTGIDLSEGMVAIARERMGSRVCLQVGDAEVESLGRECYDLIAANAVIHWFQNPLNTLRRMVEALRPGGFLICSTFGTDTLQELAKIYKTVEEEMNLPPSRQTGEFLAERGWLRFMKLAGIPNPKFIQCWQRLPYPSGRDLLWGVQGMGAGGTRQREGPLSPIREKLFLEEVLRRYDRFCRDRDGVYATFQLIQLYGKKGWET